MIENRYSRFSIQEHQIKKALLKTRQYKIYTMKKLIIITVIAGFISLSFTAVNNTPNTKVIVKSHNTEKIDFSHKLDEKRLASWD